MGGIGDERTSFQTTLHILWSLAQGERWPEPSTGEGGGGMSQGTTRGE
jgi:hypothetical protein